MKKLLNKLFKRKPYFYVEQQKRAVLNDVDCSSEELARMMYQALTASPQLIEPIEVAVKAAKKKILQEAVEAMEKHRSEVVGKL